MKQKTRYTDEQLQSSTILMYGSKSTYNYARKNKLMHLPSENTVRKRTGHFQCDPGYQEDILNLLKERATAMDPISRNCALIFDECDLKGVWSYNQRLRQNFPPCKKLLVVMVRGLVQGFKEIVYFKGDQMMTEDLLMELVEKIEETGIKTRIISCDMGNQQVLKI